MVGSERCSLHTEGGKSRGARIFRERAHVTPRVFWIPSLCLHVEYPQGISYGGEWGVRGEKWAERGKGGQE